MLRQFSPNTLTFVWHPTDQLDLIYSMKAETGFGAIVDLSLQDSIDEFLSSSDLSGYEVKITWKQFKHASTLHQLKTKNIKNIWLECFPEIHNVAPEIVIEELSHHFGDFYLVTGDIDLIAAYFRVCPRNVHLALKGTEASGFSGTETLFSLFSYVEQYAENCKKVPKISVWGGISTPEGAAALLKSGAHRLVFEYIHILTDFSACSENSHLNKKISTIRIDHTALLPIAESCSFRMYDKGNSQVSSLIKTPPANCSVVDQISDRLVPLRISGLEKDQLIPIGPEAAYASSFCDTYGLKSKGAIKKFAAAILRVMSTVDKRVENFINSSVKKEFGCAYPFIQGGMACITDIPEFTLAVAEAGGLPTFALGIQRPGHIEDKLNTLLKMLAGVNYAINIITLSENVYLEEQLEWIKRVKPPFVVISAGSPLAAKQLQDVGIEVIYVTSDQYLLRLAWENNIRYVVCEGHEAGGHIGSHSTLTIAQSGLELRRQNSSFSDKPLILAGGFFNAATIYRAAVLGAEAVQLGTVYLATREIIETGALEKKYQELVVGAGFGDTTVTGQAIGLSVRSLKSPVIEKLKILEQDLIHSGSDESLIRLELEKTSIGSLAIAARAQLPGHTERFSSEACYLRGQYMSGSAAGGIAEVVSITELHERLAALSSVAPLFPEALISGEISDTAIFSDTKKRKRIAITGMAVSNALGNSPETVWQAALEGKCGITEIPPTRWDHAKYYSADPREKGKTYCNVGAFLSLDISRKDLGISPHDFRTMTHSSKMTFWLADKVIKDSGLLESGIPPERIGVIISQNAGELAHTIEDLTFTVKADELAVKIQQALNLDTTTINDIVESLCADRITIDDTTLLGRLSCTAGGFICNKYNFRGLSFAVTAACATGLVALFNAVQLIRNNIIDVAIVGGGEELLHPASFLEFSALKALAGQHQEGNPPEKSSRPFDSDRDGMVLGEGGAMLVVEREDIAAERNADIYAYITGVGASNNNVGMVESVAETQEQAIKASFQDASYDSAEVDLVECHATATPTGDIEEIKALKEIFPQNSGTVLSSFKSQIGHTLGASGLNSLVRGVSAMQAGIFPHVLNYDTPDPSLSLESWGFKVCRKPEIWPHTDVHPRRCQVNAFGFGGANYVIQLEQADWHPEIPDNPTLDSIIPEPQDFNVCDITGLSFYSITHGDKNYRVGVRSVPGHNDCIKTCLEQHVTSFASLTDSSRNLTKNGIFAAEATPPGKLALIFAGQGTHYHQMGKELYASLPIIRSWMDKIAELADFDILHMLFNEKETNLRKTVWQQPALFVLEYAIYQQLKELDIQPSVLAGNSMGELTALTVAGVFSYEDAYRIIAKRAVCMEKASTLVDDPGSMIAVDVPIDELTKLVSDDSELYFTNYNSPRQIVIGGSGGAITELERKLGKRNYWSHILPVSMAFHSPIMRVIRDELGDYLADVDFQASQVPVLSNTTKTVYPDKADEIRKIILSHLESPVHWQDNVTTMSLDFGVDVFVEVGPQDTLCKLLADTCPESTRIHTCYPKRETKTLQNAVAALFSLGHVFSSVDHEHLTVSLPKPARKRDENEIRTIIQREINSFALQGVERYLKPAIVKTIQRSVDPGFSAHDLEEFLSVAPADTTLFIPQKEEAVHVSEQSQQPDKENGLLQKPASTVEQLILIIMEATGYGRDEIEPDMDIRQDLSIRSSRLPIIMDAAERTFSITIVLEDFLDVRTIAEFADKIDFVKSAQGGVNETPSPQENRKVEDKSSVVVIADVPPVQRFTFQQKELLTKISDPLSIPSGSNILLIQLEPVSYAEEMEAYLVQNYGVNVVHFSLTEPDSAGKPVLREIHSQQLELNRLADTTDVAGVVLLTGGESSFTAGDDSPGQVCTALLLYIQTLVKGDTRLFFFHLRLSSTEDQFCRLIAQGILGILLSAQIEYARTLFRSMWVRDLPDMKEIFDCLLDSQQPLVELELSNGTLYTQELNNSASDSFSRNSLEIFSTDVIVVSAGAAGVTARLVRSLSKFCCTFILLGRSVYRADIDYSSIPGNDEELLDYVRDKWPLLSSDDQEIKFKELQTSRNIFETIESICREGAEAVYLQCDVARTDEVAKTFSYINEKYGKVDGIIHGAGILRDRFVRMQSPDDFQAVVDVKYTGLHNLLTNATDGNLRFVLALSSLAAITGNVGQANYCCGNRMMTSYLDSIVHVTDAIIKTVFLPPIKGAGMADDPEVRELISLKIGKDAFVNVCEIAELISRELLAAPSCSQVAFVRKLPSIQSVALHVEANHGGVYGQDCVFLPMIDRITHVDFRNNRMQAMRVLTHEKDLWLNDHKPFKWLENPIVSAIMVVETMFETASLFYPYLHAAMLRDVRFDRILECPSGSNTEMDIACQAESEGEGTMCCTVRIGRLSESGSAAQSLHSYFSGSVLLTAASHYNETTERKPATNFLEQKSIMSRSDIDHFYDTNCGLTGRYRVLNTITACDQTKITATMIYPEVNDFCDTVQSQFRYPHYILEALMQLPNFHFGMVRSDGSQIYIPTGFSTLKVVSPCKSGDTIYLHVEQQEQDANGSTWLAKSFSNEGRLIMEVTGLSIKTVE